jgi:hypothetical protein
MVKDILKLFTKIFLAAIPLLMLLIIYLKDDPFKVIYTYQNFYVNNKKDIPLNRDYVSTEILLKNYTVNKYDSYIFGSSRSMSFICSDWNKYINGKIFHFDASGESIYGILKKLVLLQKQNMPIKNCLVIIDSATFALTGNSDEHMYIKHPLVSDESRLKFQFTFLSVFLSNKFFVPYIFYKFGKKPPDFMDFQGITDVRAFSYNDITNDTYFSYADDEISNDINKFYEKYKHLFYKRDTLNKSIILPLLGEKQQKELYEIKKIFENNNTSYKFVIYPVYDQRYLNPSDVMLLKNIFGTDNIADYSGINDITNNITNYYEPMHCRSIVGEKILKEIYSK